MLYLSEAGNAIVMTVLLGTNGAAVVVAAIWLAVICIKNRNKTEDD